MVSTKRERLSRRFWLLGPSLAVLCLGVDLLITLAIGFPARGPISGWVPQDGSGPALVFSLLRATPLGQIPGVNLLFGLGGLLFGLLVACFC